MLGDKYPIPQRKNAGRDGVMQMGFSSKLQPMTFESIAMKVIAFR